MGMDLLDLVFRLEREFDVELSHDSFAVLVRNAVKATQPGEAIDIEVVDIMVWVADRLHAEGKPVPPDLFPRIRVHICDVLGVGEDQVTKRARLVADLGME